MNQEDVPQIEPYFGRKFETEIEIQYISSEKSGAKSGKDAVTIKNVQVKANANLEKGMIVVHALDRETSQNVTTVLDTKNQVMYNINTEKNVCMKIQVPKDALAPANMSQPQMKQEFTKGTQNFTYLGEYQPDDVLCDAFEMKVDARPFLRSYPPSREHRRYYAPDVVTVTVYYPKDKKHWSKTESVAIPKLTEVRLFDSVASKEFTKATVHVKSFNPKPKDPEKIDISKCTDMNRMSWSGVENLGI